LDTRSHLAQADLAPLLATYVHLSGDRPLLETYRPYITGPWAFHEATPEMLKEALYDRLATLLDDLHAGRRHAARPDRATLHEIMNTCVGQPVPDEYLPLILHDIGVDETAPLDVSWRTPPERARLDRFKVLIIGAGESGLCAAIKLRQIGIGFVMVERNDHVGGTWYENDYPGCAVDTPNHFYQYSFEPNHDWSRYFSPAREIRAYLDRCADKYGIRPLIRFRTEVLALHWEDSSSVWSVRLRRSDGVIETLRVQAVISAVGHISIPSVPSLPGLDEYEGPRFHTSRWDHSVALNNKRVGMIGTGASGMQVGPSIIDEVASLSIFQRSAQWAIRNPLYFSEVKPGKKWALKNVPFYANWYRFQLFWASADGLHPKLRVDPGWTHHPLSLNAEHDAIRQSLVDHLTEQLEGDAELIRKAMPAYPPYGKRMLRDNHWYRMLKNPKTALVTESIERVTREGVRTADGVEHPLDVIVFATGFQASRLTWPMEITGRGSVTLRERWGEDDPRAYLGMTVPGFPNLFLMFGPNTNLAHGGSAIFHSECQTRYILLALRELIESGSDSLECRPDVHDEYNRRVDDAHAQMVWTHPRVSSWYRNSSGRVFSLSPWRLLDYWDMTRHFDPAQYRIERTSA
jgi:4-hydroxyacetophenone monooxygenase